MNDTPSAPQASDVWLQRGFVGLILLSAAVAMSYNFADPDLWGHIRYGEDLLRDGLPAYTTYSYTAQEYKWVNHENFAEIVLAITNAVAGAPGLMLLKTAFALAAGWLMLQYSRRRGVHILASGSVLLIAASVIGYRWAIRPQLFTYMYFTLMMALLGYCFEGWNGRWHVRLPWLDKLGWNPEATHHDPAADSHATTDAGSADQRPMQYSHLRMRALWLMPLLICLWTNSHGGFAAGLAVYTAYLLCRSLEAVMRRGWEASGILKRFALMIFAACFATFLNPYGPGLHQWMLASLGSPRPEITEWWPPEMLTSGAAMIWILIGLFVTSLVFTRKPRDFTQLVLLGVTFWQSMEHQRHLPFFAILCAMWLPEHVQSLFLRIRGDAKKIEAEEPTGNARLFLYGGLAGAYVVLLAMLVPKLIDVPVPRSDFPVSAVDYVKQNRLNGKMVVTYNWAQYAIAALGPATPEGEEGVKVSFDGRFRTSYPAEVVDMHFDFLLGDGDSRVRHRDSTAPFDPVRVLEYRRPELLLLSRYQKHSTQTIEQHRDQWVLLYQDELAQVWGLRWKFGSPKSPDFVPPANRRISDQPQTGVVAWPAIPVQGSPLPAPETVVSAPSAPQ